MINKSSQLPSAYTSKSKHRRTSENTANVSNSIPTDSPSIKNTTDIVEQITTSLNLKHITSVDDARQAIITQTLTHALGEKISSSVVYKTLFNKIEAALKDSQHINELLERVQK
ncbi:hypothetical protein [Flocculibacter collagenilyticus]|uniref:hypothetical protein n=1 Tax=Flocculibacter collagenilyticus TaxID=2744479 RepID=UPI0018F5434E|nr:hypothetical protein [Flocculibacter collagenilyticus]